jgi:methionyl-tRNA synthetase
MVAESEYVQLCQLVGKYNVPDHGVIFLGSQIGTLGPWTKLYPLSTTGYLIYQGGKFSKSRGVGISADSAKLTGV